MQNPWTLLQKNIILFSKGRRLFMLKNPWNHLRWKGRFSEHDTKHWTPEMQSILNYDPKSAQSFDNGKESVNSKKSLLFKISMKIQKCKYYQDEDVS